MWLVYATTGILIEKFLMLGLCDQWYVFTCCLWWFNVGTSTQYSIVYVFLYVFVFISYILRVGRKFAKMSLSANRSSALHDKACYMLFVMAWLQLFVKSYSFTYSTVIYMYCIVLKFCFQRGKMVLIYVCCARLRRNWIVHECAVKGNSWQNGV